MSPITLGKEARKPLEKAIERLHEIYDESQPECWAVFKRTGDVEYLNHYKILYKDICYLEGLLERLDEGNIVLDDRAQRLVYGEKS